METIIISKHESDIGDGDTNIITLASISNGKFTVRNIITHEGCEPFECGTTIYPTKAAAEAAYNTAIAA